MSSHAPLLIDYISFTSYRRLSDVEIKITFDLECLWLRTRICLLKCLHSALSCLTSEEAAKDEKLMPKMLRQQIDELCSTLESVDQHVGTMLLKQRAKHQLVSVYWLLYL